jgi:hypothetical protein
LLRSVIGSEIESTVGAVAKKSLNKQTAWEYVVKIDSSDEIRTIPLLQVVDGTVVTLITGLAQTRFFRCESTEELSKYIDKSKLYVGIKVLSSNGTSQPTVHRFAE